MTKIFQSLSSFALLLGSAIALAGPVNVNTADAETLSSELSGIGMAKAQAIVEYREQHGPFQSAEDLLNVAGIGERTLELNRAFILLDKAAANAKN